MFKPYIRLPLQESLLLQPTLLDIHKEEKEGATSQTQSKEKVEWTTIVAGIIDDGTAYQRSNESAGLSDDRKKTEEQELFASGCDLADHRLRVAVPWAHE